MNHPEQISFEDFHEAWNWLHNHPYYYDARQGNNKHMFSVFGECTDIYVVKVNPHTDEVDDRDQLNTRTQVWLETGKMDFTEGPTGKSWRSTHDWDLDCGGDTYEEAIIQLAHRMFELHGDYEEDEW